MILVMEELTDSCVGGEQAVGYVRDAVFFLNVSEAGAKQRRESVTVLRRRGGRRHARRYDVRSRCAAPRFVASAV